VYLCAGAVCVLGRCFVLSQSTFISVYLSPLLSLSGYFRQPVLKILILSLYKMYVHVRLSTRKVVVVRLTCLSKVMTSERRGNSVAEASSEI